MSFVTSDDDVTAGEGGRKVIGRMRYLGAEWHPHGGS